MRRCLQSKFPPNNMSIEAIHSEVQMPESGSSVMEITSCSQCAATSSNTPTSDKFPLENQTCQVPPRPPCPPLCMEGWMLTTKTQMQKSFLKTTETNFAPSFLDISLSAATLINVKNSSYLKQPRGI